MRKYLQILLLLLMAAAVIIGCDMSEIDPDPDVTEEDEIQEEDDNGSGEQEEGEEEEEDPVVQLITGSQVTMINNSLAVIEGDSFTISNAFSDVVMVNKLVPVTLAADSTGELAIDTHVRILARRAFPNNPDSAYYVRYLLHAQNNGTVDYKIIEGNPCRFYNSSNQIVSEPSARFYGTQRKYYNNTGVNRGLPPGDKGFFFAPSNSTWDKDKLDSITSAKIRVYLNPNDNGNIAESTDSQFTVQGYSFGDSGDGDEFVIHIENSGTVNGKLTRATVFFMNGENIEYWTSLTTASTRFPAGGLLQPGQSGGFKSAASSLFNFSANKIMVTFSYEDTE